MPEAARRRVVPEPPLIRAEEREAAAPKEQCRLSQLAAVAQSEAAAEGDYWPPADLVAARQPAAAPDAAAAEVAAAALDAAEAEVAAAEPDAAEAEVAAAARDAAEAEVAAAALAAAGVVADQAAAAVQVQLEVPAQLR